LAAAACNTGSLTTNDRPRSHGPTLRWLINNFGFGDRSKLDPVVPSLFRHLAHWPKYLATLHVSLLPRFRDHSVATASNDLQKGSAKGADRDDPMTAELFTAVRVMATPLRRCVNYQAHLQREVLVFWYSR
jgi:hypothetical protein